MQKKAWLETLERVDFCGKKVWENEDLWKTICGKEAKEEFLKNNIQTNIRTT